MRNILTILLSVFFTTCLWTQPETKSNTSNNISNVDLNKHFEGSYRSLTAPNLCTNLEMMNLIIGGLALSNVKQFNERLSSKIELNTTFFPRIFFMIRGR